MTRLHRDQPIKAQSRFAESLRPEKLPTMIDSTVSLACNLRLRLASSGVAHLTEAYSAAARILEAIMIYAAGVMFFVPPAVLLGRHKHHRSPLDA